MPFVAEATTDAVPLGVVIEVWMESVAVAGYELTEVGDMVHVPPGGHPEVTARLTVPLYPKDEDNERVYEAVLPAPTLCEAGEALMEKSGPVSTESSRNVVLPSVPSM